MANPEHLQILSLRPPLPPRPARGRLPTDQALYPRRVARGRAPRGPHAHAPHGVGTMPGRWAGGRGRVEAGAGGGGTGSGDVRGSPSRVSPSVITLLQPVNSSIVSTCLGGCWGGYQGPEHRVWGDPCPWLRLQLLLGRVSLEFITM